MEFQIIAGELCLDFVNTLDNRPVPERREELLHSYRDLADWALQARAINSEHHAQLVQDAARDGAEAEKVLCQAIRLRECLYRIFTNIVRRRHPSEADLLILNFAISKAFSHLQLNPIKTGFRLGWADDGPRLDSILWPIARSASELLTSPDLRYVRECGDNACRWMFVDRSKNHSRRWCDMKICGNRVKARKFYRKSVASSRTSRLTEK